MLTDSIGETVTMLLVEDDEIDAEAIRRAFRKARIANPIEHVQDGLEALELLQGSNGKQPLQRPYLILLDLNMPRMNGIEFLKQMRRDEQLRDSVVFVLTTSDDDQDKLQAYESQVAGYIVKSKAGEDFVNLIGMLDHYWRVVELPPEHDDFRK
ncbi:MAG: response regulator [Lacipirellulaceae bacterium]